MRAELANVNYCAIPFLSCVSANNKFWDEIMNLGLQGTIMSIILHDKIS